MSRSKSKETQDLHVDKHLPSTATQLQICAPPQLRQSEAQFSSMRGVQPFAINP